MTIERKHWILLLLALRDDTLPLDPVRIQSGMFILSHEHALPTTSRYEFEALDSGPFSSSVVSDVEELEEAGLVDRHGVSGYTWSEFTATVAGVEYAETSLVPAMNATELDALRSLAHAKEHVLVRGFRDLMDHLGQTYPPPTLKSVFH